MSILSQALDRELNTVPALSAKFDIGGETFSVGAHPLSAMDFQAVNKKLSVPFQTDPTQFEGMVDMLIRKTRALDDEGLLTDNKMFDVGDRAKLMRMKVDKVSAMFAQLFGDQVDFSEVYNEASDGDRPDGNPVDEAKGN